MRKVIMRLALTSTGAFLSNQAALAASCAVFKVSGTKDCSSLKVTPDLSRCPGEAHTATPIVSCNGDHATALLKTGAGSYLASVVLGPEKWGSRAWVMAGEVTEAREVAPSHVASTLKPTKGAEAKRATTSKGHVVSSSHKPAPPVVLASNVVAKPPVAPLTVAAVEPAKEVVPAAAPPAPSPWLSGLTISGLADVYYSYNFNKPRPVPPPAPDSPNAQSSYHGVDNTQTPYRNFDSRHNTIALNLAELSIKKTTDEMTLRLDLDFGDTADLTHRDANNNVDETSKHIGQAIITWSPKAVPGLSFNVGKMATHMGYETTKAKDNWQYSRSFVFALALPYWHTGANVVYVPNDHVSAALFVYNGWNSTVEVNNGKTLGVQLGLTPIAGLTFTYNGIGGPEGVGNDKNKVILHEGIITWAINSEWSTAIDYVYGSSEKAKKTATGSTTGRWQGSTWAVKYAPNAKYYISPRIESYWDKDGITSGSAQTLQEATLTNSYLLSEGLEARFEIRGDQSNKESFMDGTKPKKSQATTSLGLLASF